ncbi:MAG: hypothetical protein Q8O56_04275 [Solirubrobacteraceae bacterium]|nr:hypothetical protein [Solirubrobacteraceae bacterium]
MSAWVQRSSGRFTVRHEQRDGRDVDAVLDLLEDTHRRLTPLFDAFPQDVGVVLHVSRTELDLAQPLLPIMRRLTTPAARRYLVGWAARDELHVLAPRLLAERAANVEGSREMLALTPAALYVQLVVAQCNRALPPPWTPRATLRVARWAWLVAGAGQWLSGQTGHARPVIARRLREGARPSFPPSLRDAALLGGSVIDFVARETGPENAVRLACSPPSGGPHEALLSVLGASELVHAEGAWRAHLARMAGR